MSITAWVVKTFFRKPKIEALDEKVQTIEVSDKPKNTVYKVSYLRDSEYTFQDIIHINGHKLRKGCVKDNLDALSTYLNLLHNFKLDTSHANRMSQLCTVGLSEKIKLSNNVILDLKVTVE